MVGQPLRSALGCPRPREPSRTRRARPGLPSACPVVLALLLVACSPAPANATADGAVRFFVELTAHFDGNPDDAEAIFAMLSERTKKNLRARAERYGAASGRKIAPSAMLVPARMVPRFSPRSYSAQVVGKYALVDVLGVRADQRAQISCVQEDNVWRIDLVLPELPPMRTGPGRER